MNSQTAHRLVKALLQHGRHLSTYLKDYGHTGTCSTAMYLHVGETLAIGLDGYDIQAVQLTRDKALTLASALDRDCDGYLAMCQRYATGEVTRNSPVVVVSRTLKHGRSHLHSSRKTAQAKIARKEGFAVDARRAALFNAGCSQPSMMSSGKHRDPLPITIHTIKPIGLNA